MDRAKVTDCNSADNPLAFGDYVYMKNRVLGRNKIQDFWTPTLHRVTARLDLYLHIYSVQLVAGGPEQVVTYKPWGFSRPPEVSGLTNVTDDRDNVAEKENGLVGQRH